MRSTGEVASFGKNKKEAFLAAIMATGVLYPTKKAAFVSLGGANAKIRAIKQCQMLMSLGYTIYSTSGTHMFLKEHGVVSVKVGKLYEGVHPTFEDLLKSAMIDFAIVIPEGENDTDRRRFMHGLSDGYYMRRMSVDAKIPIFTALSTSELFISSLHIVPAALPILAWDEYSIDKHYL